MNDNRTSDNQHIDFGTGDDIPMPDRFTAPDNASTVSGTSGGKDLTD